MWTDGRTSSGGHFGRIGERRREEKAEWDISAFGTAPTAREGGTSPRKLGIGSDTSGIKQILKILSIVSLIAGLL